jgi:adenylate kinase family enzyme
LSIRRVVVVGCSGSGKTSLARALARVLDSPHVELDAIFHQPGWTELSTGEFQSRVDEATQSDAWVVDGNYSAVRDIVWDRADTLVWFDLPYATVLARTTLRTVRRVVTREELWNGNKEPFSNLWSVNPQKSIIAWTATHHGKYRRRYLEAETDPRWARLRFVRLRSQRETDAFVAGVLTDQRASDKEA